MKQVIKKFAFTILATALIAPLTLLAQQDEKEKEKEAKDKKEAEQIIITRKGDKNDKLVVEVNGDKIIVNGKEIKDGDGDITVHRGKIKDTWSYGGNYNYNFKAFNMDDNRAMLGVTTDKVDNGVEVQEITDESAAEKAGLKKGDIITKIDDKKIETPDDLSTAIKAHKPGEKVTVTYLRDKKEQKLTTELTKWKGSSVFYTSPDQFKMELGELNAMPRVRTAPRAYSQNWAWSGDNGPRLGLSIQDDEGGKGVKVIDVDEDGNAAKAGLKEDDLITDVDGKPVKSTDEIVKIIKDSKEKTSVKMKVLRNGKVSVLDVKIPRRVKTADL